MTPTKTLQYWKIGRQQARQKPATGAASAKFAKAQTD
jgi:hypothetical protein